MLSQRERPTILIMSWLALSPLFLAPLASSATWASTPISKRSGAPTNFAISTDGDVKMAQVQNWLAKHSFRASPPSEGYLERNADFAMRARRELKVAAGVPEELFLREVLPYQHFDEPLDDWRPDFFQRLMSQPTVRDASTLKELAETVIPLAFVGLGSKVEFKSNMTPQAMAPISETLHFGHASCTGMSILVANALRSVGVPARIAGISEWNRKDGGNHNWVEVWTGNGWHFIDAAPMTKVTWDQAWFADGTVQKSSSGIHGVYSPSWDASEANANYTIGWRTPSVLLPAIDRTAFYKAIPLPKSAGAL